MKFYRLSSVAIHGEALHSFWVSTSKLQTGMQKLILAFAPAIKEEFADAMVRETLR